MDAGQSRARVIPKTRNYPGFANGVSGEALLDGLHAQALKYGAQIVSDRVSALANEGEHFAAVINGRCVRAMRVLLATGLKDVKVNMPGLSVAVAHALVRYCPVCDAYEAIDRSIAVYGPIAGAEGKARFLRTYSRAVTLLPPEADIDSETAARLKQDGIALASSPPIDFRPARGGIEVELRNGKRMQFDVLYPVLGCEVHSGLTTALARAAMTSVA